MNCIRRWSIVACLWAGAGLVAAQQPALVPRAPDAQAVCVAPATSIDCTPCHGHGLWVSTEYLLWSVKDAPSPFPLVTTGSLADVVPGALGQPSTRVLFGGSDLDYQATSGLRFGAGFGLSSCNALAFEASGFLLERRSSGLALRSDAAGNPLLTRPFFNVLENAQNSVIDSAPNAVAGGVAAASTIRLWGWEANLTNQGRPCDGRTANLLLGFRSLDLRETLRLSDSLSPLIPGALTFQGTPIDVGSQIVDFDSFGTHNRFYGPQLGGRMEWQRGLVSVGLLGKIALGGTRQTTSIDGASMLISPTGARTVATGGVLALGTNIGRHSENVFSVVPEVGLKAALQLAPRLRVHVGYSSLFWTNVVRPGDQIDPSVNPRLVQTSQDFANPARGPLRPAFSSHSSDFWAHGVDFGVELRYQLLEERIGICVEIGPSRN